MSTIAQQLAADLKQESQSAIASLKRVPADKLDWRPHAKSMTLGELSGHISDIPKWVNTTLETDKLEMEGKFEQWVGQSGDEMAARFEEHLAAALPALESFPDERLSELWSLVWDGKTMFQMPKIAVIHVMILKHLIHHRAQLGVYLRLLDIPVPSVYGPSADEAPF